MQARISQCLTELHNSVLEIYQKLRRNETKVSPEPTTTEDLRLLPIYQFSVVRMNLEPIRCARHESISSWTRTIEISDPLDHRILID